MPLEPREDGVNGINKYFLRYSPVVRGPVSSLIILGDYEWDGVLKGVNEKAMAN